MYKDKNKNSIFFPGMRIPTNTHMPHKNNTSSIVSSLTSLDVLVQRRKVFKHNELIKNSSVLTTTIHEDSILEDIPTDIRLVGDNEYEEEDDEELLSNISTPNTTAEDESLLLSTGKLRLSPVSSIEDFKYSTPSTTDFPIIKTRKISNPNSIVMQKAAMFEKIISDEKQGDDMSMHNFTLHKNSSTESFIKKGTISGLSQAYLKELEKTTFSR